MKKIFLSCLIVFALVLSSCNQTVMPPTAKEISIDASQIEDSSTWMNINQNTKVDISNIADDEIFVM